MKKILILAVAAAIVTAVLLYVYLNSLREMSKIEYENVVVAAVEIPAYTKITSDMVTIAQIPSECAHPQAIHNTEETLGLVSDGTILVGEMILSGQLKSIGKSGDSLSYLIEDGMRAVTIAVDEVSGLAGYIRQNDRVDVLVTIDVPNPTGAASGGNGSKNITTAVAENIRVLAAGTTISDKVSEEGTAGYSTVTLLAEPDIAQRIVFAAAEGRVCLILRSVTDESKGNNASVDRSDVEGW